MRGTKLWTESRSPLISGRSRHARSFTREWLTGSGVACALIATAMAVRLMPDWAPGPTLAALGVAGVAGAFFGAGSGVTLARGMGWLRPWIAAATVGTVAGTVAAAASMTFVGR